VADDSPDQGYPASGPSADDRDRYMRLLDRALERGLLADGDYMLRADALARATDIEQMNEIVQHLPVLETPTKVRATRSGGRKQRTEDPAPSRMIMNLPADLTDQTEEPPFDPDDLSALDAVDLAMLMRSVQTRKAASGNRRFMALVIVGVLFLVLVVLGLYLASHEHAVNSNGIVMAHLSAAQVRFSMTPLR
jgi:hypothetical protein